MKRMEVLMLLAIVAIGVFLRFWNLDTTPHFDFDEGVNLDIASNLAEGRMQWACLTYPFVPHPPFFFIVVAACVKLFGGGLIVERSLTALCGVAATVLVYLVARRLFSARVGLLASLLYAIYPSAIFFSRIGFANNLIILLLLVCMYFLVRYLDDRRGFWMYLAAASAGLSAVTEVIGFCTVASLLVLLWAYDRMSVLKAAIVGVLPFAVFVVVMAGVMHDAFIADLSYSSGRFDPLIALSAAAAVWLFAAKPHALGRLRGLVSYVYKPVFDEFKRSPFVYVIFFILAYSIVLIPPSDDLFFAGFDYHWVGLAGFLAMKEKKQRDVVGVFFLVFFVALLGFDRSDHMIMPLYPMLSIGLGFLFSAFFDFSTSFFGSMKETGGFAVFLSAVLLAAPALVMLYYDVDVFVNGNWVKREDTLSRAAVADYLNENTAAGDVVIVDSVLATMVSAQPAVLVQAASFDGHVVEFIRPDYGRSRFLADCSYRNARFIVIGNETLGWVRNESAFSDLTDEVGDWPTTRIGGFFVYRNPNLQ